MLFRLGMAAQSRLIQRPFGHAVHRSVWAISTPVSATHVPLVGAVSHKHRIPCLQELDLFHRTLFAVLAAVASFESGQLASESLFVNQCFNSLSHLGCTPEQSVADNAYVS